jgi:putative DNA primase/helicase
MYIAEGFATASSIAQATDSAVAVCFSAAQMLPVARMVTEKFPLAKLVICADNDVRNGDTPNTGLEAATEAATALSALLAAPELKGHKADFNDLHCEFGLDAVRERLALAALTEQTLLQRELKRLCELGPVRYDQERKQLAKRLGVSAGSIDKEIKLRKQQAAEDQENDVIEALFESIEPYDGKVNGRELVSAIRKSIQRYVVLPDHEATAAALWVIHSHAVEAAFIAPILLLISPQKRCGKSTLLDVLRSLVYRGLMVNSVSTAVVYRTMDIFKPTLLIDEADAFLDLNEELRGIINGGHSRNTAKTLRIGGANRDKVEVFDSFGPKAIAGIGKRRDTIIDRSIQINMRRRRPNETVEPLRQDRLDNRQLQSFCSGWTAAHLDALRDADPPVPDTLHDRAADNWRPLLAIADLCGFGTEARRAALKLTSSDDDDNAGVMILEDLQRMFAEEDVDRLASTLVVERLGGMEDRPWSEWGRSRKPITPRQLAKLLEPFQIKPRTIRINTSTTKGYLRTSFEDAFSRYLPDLADFAVTASHSSSDADSRFSQAVTRADPVTDASVTGADHVTDAKQPKRKNGEGCDGVSDNNADLDGGKEKADDSEEDLKWTEF